MMAAVVEHRRGPAPALANGAWVATAVVAVAGLVFTAMAWPDLATGDSYANVGASVAGVLYASIGLLIVRRVRNAIGSLLLIAGIASAGFAAASAYAITGVATHPGALPGARVV